MIACNLNAHLVLYGQVFVGFNPGDAVVINVRMGIVPDMPDNIVLNARVKILLSVQIDLLLSGLILKTQFIEYLSLMRFGTQHGTGFVDRQVIRRALGSMVGSARYVG